MRRVMSLSSSAHASSSIFLIKRVVDFLPILLLTFPPVSISVKVLPLKRIPPRGSVFLKAFTAMQISPATFPLKCMGSHRGQPSIAEGIMGKLTSPAVVKKPLLSLHSTRSCSMGSTILEEDSTSVVVRDVMVLKIGLGPL